MIFATVGTQLGFPRLIRALDDLAAQKGLRIVAQIGPDPGEYRALEVHGSLASKDFARLVDQARVIVGHAGIGTILSAQAAGKPLILMPRRADRGEHRNDHQTATTRAVAGRIGVHVAQDADALRTLLTAPALTPMRRDGPSLSRDALIGRLRELVEE
ncbi:glycosyltransferase [Pseudooceanicola sp. MF1-13]|uniref:glycosyltransferase n=1 Tax=Pseudooceanicola sp. MF1-13 TaxID=3379095 RepID=UPI0038928F02